MVPPLLQTRNMHLASPRIRDLASAWMTTAFNVGIGGGALVGAALLPLGGVEVLPWVGAAVMAVALAIVAGIAGKSRRKGSAGSVIV
jgi:predicted MFS family arabinose efflux permease